jgi:hypothetical protein
MLLAKLIHNSLKSSLMGAIVCLGLGKKRFDLKVLNQVLN